MPRSNTSVKGKTGNTGLLTTIGAVDMHIHGAFGIDIMNASPEIFDELSMRLWEHGVSAFCPTTLSTNADSLTSSVTRIGRWIRSGSAPGAIPLGIHLEGPFLNKNLAGAHPARQIRPFDFDELNMLWTASLGTLKIITLAAELIPARDIKKLAKWSKKYGITLSLGHSAATESQARLAFDLGISGVTHAWNAMRFHHRDPGILGAAIGRQGIHIEIIPDGIHVSQSIIRWLCRLHMTKGLICFVSDAAPAAQTQKGWHQLEEACRLRDGTLAGGGALLPNMYRRWLMREAALTGAPPWKLLQSTLKFITTAPLIALNADKRLLNKRLVTWKASQNGIEVKREKY